MVTFTLPGDLRQIARSHQRLFYGLLMKCAAEALQTLGWDSRFVGGQLAMMGVLHTWGRDLSYHPHVHMIVAGGGLWADEGLWLEAKPNYLVSVKALSVIFAAKFRDALKKADPPLFSSAHPSIWKRPWALHSKSVGRGQAALKYLTQYVFRPAISNKRLVSMTGGTVTYRWQHSQTRQWNTTTLDPIEFIRRYLQHVLPRGLVKVRYYGLYAHRHRELLGRLRHQLLPATTLHGESDPGKQHPGQEPDQPAAATTPPCRCCGKPMRLVEHIPRGGPWPHAPPGGTANHPGYRKHDLSIHHNVPADQP